MRQQPSSIKTVRNAFTTSNNKSAEDRRINTAEPLLLWGPRSLTPNRSAPMSLPMQAAHLLQSTE